MSEETKETSESKPVPQTETARELAEKEAGDQGLLIQTRGTHDTNPFPSPIVTPPADNGPSSPEAPAPDTADSSGSSTPEGSAPEGE